MAYTTIKKPSDYFNTKLYTGNGSTQSITGVGFQPDWVWIKNRIDAASHNLYDNIRGADACIQSNQNFAEFSQSNNGLTSFDSDGFSVGNVNDHNGSGDAMVSWNWLASNTTASNSDGSITSTVSANTTSGFSIISRTGTGSVGTVGHGLGSVPKMIITKKISASDNWGVYHSSLGATKYLVLNDTSSAGTSTSPFNNTEPTSSVFTVGTGTTWNGSGETFIDYCFAEKKGFSKFGSYTGNGNADGTFVYTGFKPAWVMLKRTDASGERWNIKDNKRNGFNQTDPVLTAEANFAERDDAQLDLLSSGFKIRTSAVSTNASGGTYIYMAFAENPLVGTNNIPATAR